MTNKPVIALSAGEASGDNLGAQCIRALRARHPQARFYGIGGEAMRQSGMEVIADYSTLAVMGYWRVLPRLPAILSLRRRFLRRLAADKPDVFIGIDAPDFNLSIARRVKQGGGKSVQYVAPSVWMWRQQRLHKIRQSVDSLWCLLPFETDFFRRAGIAADYVGHPAAQAVLPTRTAAREKLGLANAEAPIIALLPGSRDGELVQHLPLFAEVLQKLTATDSNRRFIAAAHNAAAAQKIRTHLPQVTLGDLPDVLAAADVAAVKSGTVTLQTALASLPFVMVYKMSAAAYAFVRFKKFHLPFFCLPNILARRFIVPELIQADATPAQITAETERLLTDIGARNKMRTAFADIRTGLLTDPLPPADALAGVMPANGGRGL